MIIKLIITKDYKTWNSYKTLLRHKVIKELNYKKLCHLF